MDWYQVFTIIGFILTPLIWIFTRLEKDINNCTTAINACNTRQDMQMQRIDALYGIIIQMLKDRKEK